MSMSKVYVLYVVYPTGEYPIEEQKVVMGVYSTEDLAERAKKNLEKDPDKEFNEYYEIREFILDA